MKKKVEWPVDVSPWFGEAQKVVEAVLRAGVPIDSAILDDWNAGTDQNGVRIKGPRIIWGLEACRMSRCSGCKLFCAVGADMRKTMIQNDNALRLRRTLCLAKKKHLSFLPVTCWQKYLNCKTIEQYNAAFVAFVMERCDTEEKMHAELAWILGFRLLYLNEEGIGWDCATLLSKEQEMKREIIGRVMMELVCQGESARLPWLFTYNCQNKDFWKALADLSPLR
ncbi:MAG: hypothetical protein V1902_01055 [Candidatus Falkowbacteria bacterium]